MVADIFTKPATKLKLQTFMCLVCKIRDLKQNENVLNQMCEGASEAVNMLPGVFFTDVIIKRL